MNIDINKSRVKTGDSPEVKVLKQRVQVLEAQVADLCRRVPAEKAPAPEVKSA